MFQVHFPPSGGGPVQPYRPEADPAGLLASLLGLRSGQDTGASGIALSEAASCTAPCNKPLWMVSANALTSDFEGVR